MINFFTKHLTIILVFIMLVSLSACNLTTSSSNEIMPVKATVIEIEKYGHAVLDITTKELINNGYNLGDVVCVRFNSYESNIPFYDGYYTNPGDAMLRGIAPDKNVAICINYGDISKETGINIGDIVEISLKEKAANLSIQELYTLKYSNNREDFSDDATFANFREVTVGSIGEGKLYRSASPINNQCGRAAYANDLIKSAGVTTILNLADSKEDILNYLAADDFESYYYLSLYKSDKVVALDMGANFFTDEFAATMAEGLTFLAHNDPPYSIHCSEGKDRTGYTVMLIEALMGAEVDEIIEDYMLSYYNYYGISKDTEAKRYEAVLNNNLIPLLCHMANVDTKDQLSNVDLESAAIDYLIQAGMTKEDIITLQKKLR